MYLNFSLSSLFKKYYVERYKDVSYIDINMSHTYIYICLIHRYKYVSYIDSSITRLEENVNAAVSVAEAQKVTSVSESGADASLGRVTAPRPVFVCRAVVETRTCCGRHV